MHAPLAHDPMPTLTVRDVPPELLDALKASATAHRRSVNGEVLVLLEQALEHRAAEAALRARIAQLRADVAPTFGPPLTTEQIQAAIDEGHR